MPDIGALPLPIRSVIRRALQAYESETQQYLLSYKSWLTSSPYDPDCCQTCRSEDARWRDREESRQLLLQRLQTINDALAHFGPSIDAEVRRG